MVEKYLPQKFPSKHYEIIADYPQRQGKYFRAALLLLANELFNGEKDEAILSAAAMQVSEDWLLIHDDFEDHSEERRHSPSLNKIWGDELAVNAGDSLHLIMWQIMGDAIRKAKIKNPWKLFDQLNESLRFTTEGQFLELNWIREKTIDISEEDYYQMIDRKTAHYTIITPLRLGAICSDKASNADLEKIADWGIPFGRAFQIWDDLMNIESSSDEQGKENSGDILEGKRTLLLIHLLKSCTPLEKEKIEKIYSKTREEKNLEEQHFIKELFYQYGTIDYAKTQAKQFAQEAKKIFMKNFATQTNEAKELIESAIDFVVDRKA